MLALYPGKPSVFALAISLIIFGIACVAASGATAPATFNTFNYTLLYDEPDYQLYQRSPDTPKVVALRENVGVVLNTTANPAVLTIYTDIRAKVSVQASFGAQTFPGLLPGSKIAYCMILPWTRNRTDSQGGHDWRLVVITDKGQIYHNYPSRNAQTDGLAISGDVIRFDESAVWDLPERRYPATDPNATGTEYYFPCLPVAAYAYHPDLNTNPTYQNLYGNGGFGKSLTRTVNGHPVIYPRFYLPMRIPECNPFLPLGGSEPGDKVSLLAPYQSNTFPGCRMCVFMTDDGGRTWFNRYEFTASDEVSNWGNDIDTTAITTAYPCQSLSLRARALVLPTNAVKEPTQQFQWSGAIAIASISRARPAVVVTATPHNLVTGNVIAIQETNGAGTSIPAWAWMVNNTVSPTSGGNGMLFKVEVVDDRTIKLHEFIHSPSNNLPCQHIHYLNRVKDGWIIGTGEEYPNSWLVYLHMREADSYSVKLATDAFPAIRLNSGETSLQHTYGALLFDDIPGTMILAATSLPRAASGVYQGQLTGIDTAASFRVVFEAPALLLSQESPAFFKDIDGALVYSGPGGVFAISFDRGKSWEQKTLLSSFLHFLGKGFDSFVCDDYLIHYKR